MENYKVLQENFGQGMISVGQLIQVKTVNNQTIFYRCFR